MFNLLVPTQAYTAMRRICTTRCAEETSKRSLSFRRSQSKLQASLSAFSGPPYCLELN
jgi:hypothetical protein